MSNKMPVANENETELGRNGVERVVSPLKPRGARNESDAPATLPWKKLKKALLLLILVLIFVCVSLLFIRRTLEAPTKESGQIAMTIGDEKFILEVVDDDEELSKGLSGRLALSEGEGMLFVFNRPGQQCMWMKDMNFALDMIWLDASKKIVKTQENITPETFPESFCSEKAAKYVVELNAGTVDRARLKLGQTLLF